MLTTVLSRSASYVLDENGRLLVSAEREGSSRCGGRGGAVGCMATGSGGFASAWWNGAAAAVALVREAAGCLPCAFTEACRSDDVEAEADADPEPAAVALT